MVELGDKDKLATEVERIRQRDQQEPRVSIPKRVCEGLTVGQTELICATCGHGFASSVIQSEGKAVLAPKHCPTCLPLVIQSRNEEAEREERERKQAVWEELCPPLYRDTDVSKLNIPTSTIERVIHWIPNPTGIGLTGESGAGKTRLMFMLLENLHFENRRVMAFTAKRFENWCHRMFDKDDSAKLNIQSAKSVKILFIDDIGKEKYTERVESEFYDLIEYRTSHLLPILWTANATGQQLVKMMGEDRGAPIVRRLREFSTVISV